ncbi:MAG: carbonic anhydrase [Acidobacteria bacterium]|nr:carbonic anhydrase [Acidobacteriota bacterium]
MRYQRAVTIAVVMLLTIGSVPVRSQQPSASPLDRLKAGNERFVKDAAASMPINTEKRLAQVKGQSPFAIVLSCADSRVPPEVIFNAGLGELFVVRTAGEVADKAVLASVEYGAEHLNASLLVVMGHEACGAVKAAIESKPGAASMGPNLDALVAAIKPGFGRMDAPADIEHIREAILANVEQVINDILSKSAIVKHLVGSGKLQAVGAFYEFSTGRVRFSEPVKAEDEPQQRAAAAHK